MALCQISHFDRGDLTARLAADVRSTDVRRVGCAVRVDVGTTGGSVMFACRDEDGASALLMTLRAVLK